MEKKYQGMTVNERLYVSGLLKEFDKAIEQKDISKATSILKQVELSDDSIGPILERKVRNMWDRFNTWVFFGNNTTLSDTANFRLNIRSQGRI